MQDSYSNAVILINGYPGFKARRLVERLLLLEPGSELCLLVHRRHSARAREELRRVAGQEQARIQLIEGDPAAIDFGLSGVEYLKLADSVQVIYNLFQVSDFGVTRAIAEAINIGGMREVIEFGRVCRSLRKIVHFSNVMVSGDHSGFFREQELDVGQAFTSVVGETLARAERMLQLEQERLPFSILRSGIILGEPSQDPVPPHTLEAIITFIVGAPDEFGFPLPLRPEVRLPVVPLSFVIELTHRLGVGGGELGHVFQLVDPDSPSVRQFVELVAAESGKRLIQNLNPSTFTRGLFRNTGFGLFRRSPRALFELFNTPVSYGTDNARQLLAHYGLEFPPFQRYLPPWVQSVQARWREGSKMLLTSEAEEFAG